MANAKGKTWAEGDREEGGTFFSCWALVCPAKPLKKVCESDLGDIGKGKVGH